MVIQAYRPAGYIAGMGVGGAAVVSEMMMKGGMMKGGGKKGGRGSRNHMNMNVDPDAI